MDANSHNDIRVRFAPSPTGFLHVGVARTAIFNYLFARKHGGTFVLRIEDTDKERSKKEFEEDILAGLSWLGIVPDETYRQSERTEVYTRYIEKLIADGHAYEAEPAQTTVQSGGENENGTGKVIRFKNPNTEVTFQDAIRGDITFDTSDLGDFVIAKDAQTPLYQLTVVVDDHEMGITHIIRGEDLISSTPRQMLIARAIGATEPTYAHLPLILGPDKSKLSKRHGAVSLSEYARIGYLPDGFVNFLALLGWNPGTDQEVFSREGLIESFSLDQIQKGGAIFNTEKLDWVCREHARGMSTEALAAYLKPFIPEDLQQNPLFTEERLGRIMPIIQERLYTMVKPNELKEEVDLYFQTPDYAPETLVWKDTAAKDTQEYLTHISGVLENTEFASSQDIKDAIWEYADTQGRGAVLWPLRFALSGKEKSPDPFAIAFVLGKEETLNRIRTAIEKLHSLT